MGSLASIEAVNSPQVLAEVAGRVAAVSADVGMQVKPGQLLLTLDPAELRNSQLALEAEVARLGALADQQRRNVVRYRDLLAQGFISTPRWMNWWRSRAPSTSNGRQPGRRRPIAAGWWIKPVCVHRWPGRLIPGW